jgi:hypothetical protein
LGEAFAWTDETTGKVLWNIPTKNFYYDGSEMRDVERTVRTIRDLLLEVPHWSIAMPMIGLGMKDLDPDKVRQLHTKHLEPLPNVIHISRLPSSFPKGPPKYLGVVGATGISDPEIVKEKVDQALTRWDLKTGDFAGLVSGDQIGVEYAAIGPVKIPSSDDHKTTIATKFKMRPIMVESNPKKYGSAAGRIRNRSIVDLVTHCVIIVKDGSPKDNVMANQIAKMISTHNKSDKTTVKKPACYFSVA